MTTRKQQEQTITATAMVCLLTRYGAADREWRMCYRTDAAVHRRCFTRTGVRAHEWLVFSDHSAETTVAVEAKSRRTIVDRRAPQYRPAMALGLAAVIAAVFMLDPRAWPGATPVIVAIVGALVLAGAGIAHDARPSIPAGVRQVLRYPANQRRLVVPADCWKMLDAGEHKFFARHGATPGIGLLVMSRLGDGNRVRAPTSRRASALRRDKDAALARSVLRERSKCNPYRSFDQKTRRATAGRTSGRHILAFERGCGRAHGACNGFGEAPHPTTPKVLAGGT